MSWELHPEPADDKERAVLLAAAEQALLREAESAWWRSGQEDLNGQSPATHAWRDSGLVEP